MKIPDIVLEEAEKRGFLRRAALLGQYQDQDIYSLGVDSKENWIPCPPLAPVIVAVKSERLTVLENEEAFKLALFLCEMKSGL